MEPRPIILVVEDERLVAMAVADILDEAGYEVDWVADGKAALASLDASADKYVALITDVRLPSRVDGWTIARHARSFNPSLPVVYVSGDSAGDWAVQGVPKSFMMQKPFANAQLVTAVTTLINEANLASLTGEGGEPSRGP